MALRYRPCWSPAAIDVTTVINNVVNALSKEPKSHVVVRMHQRILARMRHGALAYASPCIYADYR